MYRILSVLLAVLLLPLTLHAAPPSRPNIVLILADDLGWKDLGCYGSSFHETPNLDRLASQGMRFTQAYAAASICSPTRASLLTGKYPARLHITDWIGGGVSGKLLPAPYLHQLPLEEVTIAQALKEAGYKTGHFGKWHLGGKGFYPHDHGFDVDFANGFGAGQPPSYFYPYSNKQKPSIITDGKPGEYLTDRLTDEAISFIEANKSVPFFVYLPHYAVHKPLQGKAAMVAKYEKKKLSLPPGPVFAVEENIQTRIVQDNPIYAAMMESLDDSVGRIMETLKRLDLERNTIVLFTSDNGGLSQHDGSTSNRPLRAGKGWLYEGGIREPLLVRYPGHIKPGSACDTPIISNDYFPTLMALAGVERKPAPHIDGIDISPLLRGETIAARPLFWHYPHYHTKEGGWPSGAVRVGDFKLIEWFEDMRVELYDLHADMGETNDLAAKNPAKAAELTEMLHAWRKSVDATMPLPNPKHQLRADLGVD
jgi:arylsulfatase A-like enzyme